MKAKFLAICAAIALLSACCGQQKTPGEYVDPNIGGVAPLLTTVTPQVHRPHSMIRVFPVTKLSDRYLSDRMFGISLNMPRYRFALSSYIMPTTGSLNLDNDGYSSFYDHSIEQLHPWQHRVFLQDYSVWAEWSTTERAVFFEFDYSEASGKNANVIFDFTDHAEVSIENGQILSGYQNINYAKQFFYAVVDTPFAQAGINENAGENATIKDEGAHLVAWLTDANVSGKVNCKVGISYISVEQAKANLEKEIGDKTLAQIEKESRDIWESALGKIKIEGGTESQKTIFYTCLYRANERMVNQSEYGKYYSGFDNAVHEDEGRPFYNDDWCWDTHRCLHALGFLLDPQREADELNSFTRMYEQWGWVPQFPEVVDWGIVYDKDGIKMYGEPMIGNHVSSILAEGLRKGVTDFNIEKLYEGLKKNALEATMLPWGAGAATELDKKYSVLGYYPALELDEKEPYPYVQDDWEKRQAVSITLEHSYDDWCLAQVAKYLGKDEDYNLFMERSKFYLNLWNPENGFFSPKNEKGDWIKDFDPEFCGGFGARRYFTENGACVQVFNVPHDIDKLMELMGGKEGFVGRLDKAYNEGPQMGKWRYMGGTPDATGLHGMIPNGNEPAFHVSWLYNYAGEAWKTQHRVRQIMNTWYTDEKDGLCGDEDGGALCAWYVFAGMGFYPVSPVTGEYAITSPMFSKVEMALPDGKTFTILAPGASDVNKYIKEVKLNGVKLTRPFIRHEDIVAGATLEFTLVDRPCPEAFAE